MALLSSSLRAFLQHAKIDRVEAFYEDCGVDMVVGKSTHASCNLDWSVYL